MADKFGKGLGGQGNGRGCHPGPHGGAAKGIEAGNAVAVASYAVYEMGYGQRCSGSGSAGVSECMIQGGCCCPRKGAGAEPA